MTPRLLALSWMFCLLGCRPEGRIGSLPTDPPPALPERQVDIVVQPETDQVDVLWVIDDSSSMSNDQAALAEHFPEFMAWFEESDLDYHIGVVTTDAYGEGQGGVLQMVDGARWIDVDTTDPVDRFRRLADVGTSGADAEAGLGAAYLALDIRIDRENTGFRRDAASLHTIVVSDEDDSTPEDLIDPDAFEAWYGAQMAQPDQRTFSAVVATSGDFRGHIYLSVTQTLGGAIADLRGDDWVAVLDDLGHRMTLPKIDFFLSADPLDDAVEVAVWIDGAPTLTLPDRDWTYDPAINAVRFTRTYPAPGSEVQISYWTAPSAGTANP